MCLFSHVRRTRVFVIDHYWEPVGVGVGGGLQPSSYRHGGDFKYWCWLVEVLGCVGGAPDCWDGRWVGMGRDGSGWEMDIQVGDHPRCSHLIYLTRLLRLALKGSTNVYINVDVLCDSQRHHLVFSCTVKHILVMCLSVSPQGQEYHRKWSFSSLWAILNKKNMVFSDRIANSPVWTHWVKRLLYHYL